MGSSPFHLLKTFYKLCSYIFFNIFFFLLSLTSFFFLCNWEGVGDTCLRAKKCSKSKCRLVFSNCIFNVLFIFLYFFFLRLHLFILRPDTCTMIYILQCCTIDVCSCPSLSCF